MSDAMQAAVESELRGYEATGELRPGAAAELARAWKNTCAGSPEFIASKVDEMLAKDNFMVRRWRNPEHVPPRAPSGAPASPLRRAVMRHVARGDVRPEMAEDLVASLGELNAMGEPHRIAGAVARRLRSPEMGRFLSKPAPMPEGQRRLAGIIAKHFGDAVNTFAPSDMAADPAFRDLWPLHTPEHAIVRAVARRLALSSVAGKYARAGQPLPASDSRNRAQPADGPRRVLHRTRF